MGIQTDAGELLLYTYKKHIEGDMVIGEKFKQESGWEANRIRNAINYLKDKGLIKANFFIGGNFIIDRPYPIGIDIIENQETFKGVFGFTVNLGVIQFSWQNK